MKLRFKKDVEFDKNQACTKKLRFKKTDDDQVPLTEADVDRGYRIKAIEKLTEKIAEAVSKAGYKYKTVSQTGLYIMPDFGYLGRLQLTALDDAATASYKVLLTDIHAKALPVNNQVIKQLTYEELLEKVDDIALALAGTLITPKKIKDIQESLLENRILEYRPLSKLKGFFKNAADGIKNFLDKNSADSAEKRGSESVLQGISSTLSTAFDQAIDAAAEGGKQYVKVKSTINNKTLTIELKCDFVVALTFDADPADPRKIIISKLLTPLGELDVKGKTIPQVLRKIGAPGILNIHFNVEDIGIDTSTSASSSETSSSGDAEANNGNNYWAYEIGAEAFKVLNGGNGTAEALQKNLKTEITETYALKTKASDYAKAFNLAADDKAKYALIKYFLFKETDGALSEDDAKKLDAMTVYDITKIIAAANSFNPNVNLSLLYILNYFKLYKKVNNVVINLAKTLPKLLKACGLDPANTLENVKKTNIIYSPTLFNSAQDIETLSMLLKYWYGYTSSAFKDNVLQKLAKIITKLSSEDTDAFNAIIKDFEDRFEIPDAAIGAISESDIPAIRELLLLDPNGSGDNKEFRPESEIKAIADYVISIVKKYSGSGKGSTDSAESPDSSDAEDEETPGSASKEAVEMEIDDLARDFKSDESSVTVKDETLKKLLDTVGKTSISDSGKKKALAKAILTALDKLGA